MQTSETNGSGSLSLDERINQLISLGYPEDRAETKAREELERDEELSKGMSPPGALKLPPLLEAKRLKYKIPDVFFEWQPAYDRCLAVQVSDGDTVKGTGIIMPDNVKDFEQHSSPQVVLLSAGLRALDNLRSNGIDIGHTVIINQMSPYRFEAGFVGGKMWKCMIIRDGEICASKELSENLRAERCEVQSRKVTDREGNEFFEHVYVDEHGELHNPQTPWIGDDQ